ncbi:MAG: restriction endonuclease subunit S [Saccharofermentanales bacterium]
MGNDAIARRAKLSRIAEIRAGHPFRGSVPEDVTGRVSVIQIKDVDWTGRITWEGLTTTRLEGRKDPDWVKTGDILFVARGAKIVAAYVDDVPGFCVCSQYFYLIRITSEEILPEFVAWQINQQPAQTYLTKSAEGSAQVSIRRSMLEDLSIVIPPIEQQHTIVALARSAQRERELLESFILNREQELRIIAKNLLEPNNHKKVKS